MIRYWDQLVTAVTLGDEVLARSMVTAVTLGDKVLGSMVT